MRATLYTALGLALILLAVSSGCLRYSPTPSLRYRLFLALPGSPRIGDFVAFCAPAQASADLLLGGYPTSPHCGHRAVELIKEVEHIDTLRRTASVRGHHRHSVDSRHFGDLPLGQLTRLRPLF